ncbi:DUF885 domain-containing protein [Sphingobacteriales bacterium UPWRP_1]|nr:hypothetical protein BVG80_04330 [Sphingobacteriales bacterium TSM_CSM]PSJ76083.1 DUF885 domain-containing protein [Sphingobacteriales bacterium UPWRP_1]
MYRFLLLLFFTFFCFASCRQNPSGEQKLPGSEGATVAGNQQLADLFNRYYEERMQFYPMEATTNGDNRFNDQLPNDGTADFRNRIAEFYRKFLSEIEQIDRNSLNDTDRNSYDIFVYEMQMSLEGLQYESWKIPFQQFWGLPLTIGQYATGDNVQPFKTVADYNNWLSRVSAFSTWADTAIANFKKGAQTGWVLPKALALKMIPQCRDLVAKDPKQSLFYGPIAKMPDSFTAADRQQLTDAYTKAIIETVNPTFTKLANYLQNEYLPKARLTSGINTIPNGDKYYQYLIRYWTTTNLTPDEIYNLGLKEVARIRTEMDSIKNLTGFKNDLKAFFTFMQTDKQFYPFKTTGEVLDSFANIQKVIDPNLKKMFGRTPKTPFEIRQTEAFRAASASAEYIQGAADGSRPGIFYVPVPNPAKFNSTSGMQSLFLHEAIPGHHYQISLQQENEALPKFQRFLWYGAYGEGWALYTESLGKELGLYTNPYQHMGALGDEIHRAIRLVVDVALHTGKMTREEAIQYMTDNEAISTEGAIAEIERYMAVPGQALSYKIGSLKIRELRNKLQQQLGNKFNLAAFHDEILKDGVMPLNVLERKMNAWANMQMQ